MSENSFKSAQMAITTQNDTKYPKSFKTRRYNNIKEEATSEGMKEVANALLPLLDGDTLASLEYIKHEYIEI